jgi:glycosyltransferase involved in cell wall biosynthesis
MRALEAGGASVRIASETRTWSGVADPDRLLSLQKTAELERRRLVAIYGSPTATFRPDIWLTYHNHYKAPDFLGPAVSRELRIPYVIVEASYAASRGTGPWADWLRHTRAGIEEADLIFSFTKRDEQGLRAIVPSRKLRRLAPFIGDVATEPPRDLRAAGDPVRLVTVAMMRRGAKEKSYRLLADALGRLSHRNWELDIVGDGEAFEELQELLKGTAGDRVTFHGKLEGPPLTRALALGDVFVWPGIEEAFGMAYLEAQAHGLAVAACDTAGVGEVVRDGETGLLAHAVTPSAFAAAVDQLIASEELRRDLGERARRHVLERHSVEVAARVLQVELAGLGVRG